MNFQSQIFTKGISLFWCIIFFGLSYGIFTYSSEDRSWWLTVLAFLASIIAFGAFLQVFKNKAKSYNSGDSDDTESKIIEDFGKILAEHNELKQASQKAAIFLYDEKILPHPKNEIQKAILSKLRQYSQERFNEDIKEINDSLLIGLFGLVKYQPGIGQSPLKLGPLDVSEKNALDLERKTNMIDYINTIMSEIKKCYEILRQYEIQPDPEDRIDIMITGLLMSLAVARSELR